MADGKPDQEPSCPVARKFIKNYCCAAITWFMIGFDVLTNFIYYFNEITVDEFQTCTHPNVGLVTFIATGLLIMNTGFDLFAVQYLWGCTKKQQILNKNKSKAQILKELHKNAFYEAMLMCFMVFSTLFDNVGSIILTYSVANMCGDPENLSLTATLNLLLSSITAIYEIIDVLMNLTTLVTKQTGSDMRFGRLSSGAVTKADKRITGELTLFGKIRIALTLFVPTMVIYFVAFFPFLFTGFSPRTLFPFVLFHTKMAAFLGNCNTDATTEETNKALDKVLNAATEKNNDYLLCRRPHKAKKYKRSSTKVAPAAAKKKGSVKKTNTKSPKAPVRKATTKSPKAPVRKTTTKSPSKSKSLKKSNKLVVITQK